MCKHMVNQMGEKIDGTIFLLLMSVFLLIFLPRVLQEYVRNVRQKLKAKGVEQPKIKEFMAQAPAIVK